MGIRIHSNGLVLENNIAKAQRDAENSLEKLSTGVRFTRAEPMPAERAVSDSLTSKMREISSYKRNANDGVSFVQTADAALNEVSNITIRLKELATQASSPALSDKERQFLLVEYKGLYDEVNRIAKTTSFNGMLLLNGGGSSTDEEGSTREGGISFRIGAPKASGDQEDINVIRLDNLESIIATPDSLGLANVDELLQNEEGVSLDDIASTFDSSIDTVGGSFEGAFQRIASFRTVFGSVNSRLTSVLNVLDVAHENMSAANARLRDVDYATEVGNLTRANILVQAGMSLLTQSNLPAQAALALLKNIEK